MDFYEVVGQVLELLQHQGRVSYRALKRQFGLDDDYIEDLKEEIIYAQQLAVDEDNRVLVWTGQTKGTPAPASRTAQTAELPTTPQVQPPQAELIPPEPRTPEAERRQLTVMFVDLVGSTNLSGELDPEDYREVVRQYQQVCSEVIQRYDGHVAQLLGDGLLVYFGYPQAHEDDAQRAVRAGLGSVEAIRSLNTGLEQEKGIKLAMRLGIHTGLVVVGEMGGSGRQEQLAMGETPNVAARIQSIAQPDTVVIKLAAWVSPPRVHQMRYAGWLAAHRNRRGALPPTLRQRGIETPARPVASRWAWARLRKRVFSLDLERCHSGTLRLLTALTDRPVMRRLWCHLKLAAAPCL